MLARKGYSTQVDRAFTFRGSCLAHDIDGGRLISLPRVLLVGKGEESLIPLQVWQMLFDRDFGSELSVTCVLLDCQNPSQASQAVPRSRLNTLYFGNSEDWPDFEREYAWVPKEHLLMVGKPTEEAWEEFSEAVKRALAAQA